MIKKTKTGEFFRSIILMQRSRQNKLHGFITTKASWRVNDPDKFKKINATLSYGASCRSQLPQHIS
jgi:hypothetical protein